MIKSRRIRWIFGILGVYGLFQTLSIPQDAVRQQVAVSNSFASVFACFLSAFVYDRVCSGLKEKRKSQVCLSLLYSMALGFALTAGKQLETVENLQIGTVGLWCNVLLLGVYFCPFVLYGWQWLEEPKKEQKFEEKKGGRKEFLLQWLFIFVCWIPVFLAFYPGAFVYDACDEYVQAATRSFTTHHPLAHVLLLGGFVCAGHKFFDSYNVGIALYTVFQMLVLSGVFSYTVRFIRQKGKRNRICLGSLLFYGLFPVIPMYAVCSSKDALFSAAFLLVLIKMLQLLEDTEAFFQRKGNAAVFVLASAAMMLFRNNGMYAYLLWFVVLAVGCLLQKRGKMETGKILVLLLFSLFLFLGVSQGLKTITGADDSESQEIMTVPIQQMVRTYIYSPQTYTEEEKDLLFSLIPEEEIHLYNARLSDSVKSKFNNQAFQERKAEYISLWLKVGLRKPMIYVNAWLMTSYGYWYPDAVINVYGGNTVYTFTYENSSYFGFETEYPGTRESKFPWLEEQYRRMSLELYQQKLPGISMLFSPGFLFWVFLFAVCFFVQAKQGSRVLAFSGILWLWATAVLGPTYLVRYVLILWFALPVTAAYTQRIQGDKK